MTRYSSWGPTNDGRIKPTVVADGGDCFYYDASKNEQIKSTIPGNNYGTKCGTSMAAPAVSGTVILLNQQFNQTYERLPKPATVKGSLIHTAEDLGRDGPDYKFGWGLVNATEAINYVNSSKKELIKRDNLTSLGDSKSYEVTVPESGNVKFTLVWSDYPADPGPAGKALVNNLDLIVKNSTGHRKYPYTLSWENRKDKASQDSKDNTNVVEQVEIDNSQSKQYNITISASNSINGSYQDYSLLLSEKTTVKPYLEIKNPKNFTYKDTPSFNLSSLDDMADAKFSVDGSGNYSMIKKNSTYFYNNSASISEGGHEVVFWANNSDGYWSSESVQFTLDTQNPSLNIESPESEDNISGNFTINGTWKDSTTEVEKHNYTLFNSTYSETGKLNDTLNSTSFGDGDYNISFNVTDSAGNYNNSTIQVALDNTDPNLDSFSPVDNQNFSSDFNINATWSDKTSGVNSSRYELWNSSFTSSGDLNDSINISNFENGDYNLSYLLEDYAKNRLNKTVGITFDEENPSLHIFNPSNDSFVSSNFTVNATFSDEFTGVRDANYTILNSSTQLQGDLNDSINTSKLAEGGYNITYNVSDFAGNRNNSRINVTLDETPPNLNLTSPENQSHVADNFSVKATFSDDLSGIKTANYTLSNNSPQGTGSLNSTVNSTKFSDGSYNLTANATDRAGNTVKARNELFIDNTAPAINQSSIIKDDNISGLKDVNISFEDSSGVNVSQFRWSNSSGNQTTWQDLNFTNFNTSNLSEGEYNLSVKANDTLGNLGETNLTGITVDNTDPNITLTEYNLTSTYKGWINNSKTVQTDCTDSFTGPEKVSVNGKTNRSMPGNLTVKESGNKTYSYTCHDYAGNEDTENKTFAIDSQEPNVTNVNPSNNSKTGRSFSLKIEFNDESNESGLNLSASNLNVNKGKKSFSWTNSSVKIDVSDLSYSNTVKTTGTLEDNLGHRENVYITHQVKNKPEDNSGDDSDDGGSGGGGGGGFSAPAPSNEENKTEEKQENNDSVQKITDTEDNKSYKVKPGKNKISIEDEKSKVESIETSSGSSVTVSVSNKDFGEYEPPEQTEKIDEFDISVNDSKDVEMNITFRVNKTRINEDNLNNTRLYRRNNSDWQELETKYVNSTETKYRFRSNIPGFSPFMVAVKNESKLETAGNNNLEQNKTDVPVRTVKESENKLLTPINVLSFTLVILLPLLTYMVVRKRSSEEDVDPEVDEYKQNMDSIDR